MAMSSELTKAIILAAGEGTRLRPLTEEIPKVLLPIGGAPLIEYTLTWLKSHTISEVAINLHHLSDKIKDFLGDGSRFGIKISYSWEETLLGTAGGVKRMEHFFNDTFVVVYGDILANIDLDAMVNIHRTKDSLATIAVMQVPNPWDVGIVEMDGEGRILSFVEKPAHGSGTVNLSSGGVYILEKQIFDYIPNEGSLDFGYDIFPKLLALNLPLYGYALRAGDYLIDIGTIYKYRRAYDDVNIGRLKL